MIECGDGRETVDEIHDEAEVGGRLKREMQLDDEGVVHDLPGRGGGQPGNLLV